jgi:hypothetical protein
MEVGAEVVGDEAGMCVGMVVVGERVGDRVGIESDGVDVGLKVGEHEIVIGIQLIVDCQTQDEIF